MLQWQIPGFRLRACRNDGFGILDSSKLSMQFCNRTLLSENIKWSNIELLLKDLGSEISERQGSRIGVKLFGEIQVFQGPYPSPDTDKGAVSSVRKWLKKNGVKP